MDWRKAIVVSRICVKMSLKSLFKQCGLQGPQQLQLHSGNIYMNRDGFIRTTPK